MTTAPVEARTDGSIDGESDGNAGFLRAARDGNLSEVLEYLKGSTDINTSNPNGLNALHLASKEGHVNIVNELLRRGANVEAATKKGNTALHIASLAGHEDIIKILIENGAKVNVQAQAGFTPLYMAAQEGHAEVLKLLLGHGANASLATEDGFTPLAVTLQQGHDKVVSVLLEHDSKGKVKLPALHIAAKKDDVKSAALLLQNEQNSVNTETKSGFTPLHIASHYGNTNVASLLVQRGANVNFKAKNYITPLHVAGRWGKANMVTLLLDNGAVIDERTRDGLTPLHCAARSGHEGVVDLLLERGAPNSAKTKNGLTPIHMSAQGDHVDCARLLLYHKAQLDEITVDYLTPLHVAAHCGNVKTAKLLLDRKCEPNARALNGFTPLHIACKKNRIKVVELLLKYGASIEATTESGLTPLHVASFMGHMNIVIYLIQHNANPDTPTVRGETSLHLAARANQTDIIRILLRNGATVDATAREKQTPLHIAARLGNVDNVVLLLQHGASPDATTKDMYTPLHIAAKEGHEEVAQVLLDNGASHSMTTKKGFTPLHIAAKYGNIKVARLLLQKEANPDVQGKNGLTPLHVATHYNHVNVAQLLLEHKANPHSAAKNGYTPLHIAAKKNQMDIATTLLEYGAKPNAESKNGFTPLHLAAQEGHTDIVSLLLEHQANVNATAQNGLTPMHLAAQEDKVGVAEVLLKYSSEVDPPTKAGYTPLHTASHFGQISMVRFLLDHQASVSSTTKMGYTPLHQSAQQGHVQVCNLLLKNNASPNAVTNNGQTALAIAQKLGYISVVDTLQNITEVQTIPATEDKYKVVSPETMVETIISDSEDEGDTSRLSGFLGEDSLSLDRGGSLSPLDQSFEKDVHYRHATDPRGRIISEIGATMAYPSYLEKSPNYEAEMMYYRGETLSPKDKDGKSRHDSSVFGDFSSSTLGRDSTLGGDSTLGRDSLAYEQQYRPMGELEFDDEFKYMGDEMALKKDYMEAQITSSAYAPAYSTRPDNQYHTGPTSSEKPGEPARYSSYSGSSFSTSFDPDNVPVDRAPVYSGFLISFMVDARGGAMRGCRHSGVRIIIPPRKASQPTRVTCRLLKKEKLMFPPSLNEGEGLAARILEMGPVATKFLGPIIIEVPHFASLRGKEREVIIMRSDNGKNWYEHPMAATEDAVNDALGGSLEGAVGVTPTPSQSGSVSSLWKLDHEEDLTAKRITRILTTDLPQYFALVTKVRQENKQIGEEGGVISSTVVPQVQAVFPEGALTKTIRVGLQAQPIAPELVAKQLGNRVAVSPIVTVEPRRRKFHKPITLTIPVPKASQKGMINQYGGDRPTLRLLYSISGNNSHNSRGEKEPAVWEDISDAKPMTLVNDCVSFTTTVSARFWLIDCQNIGEVTQMATALYKESIIVPYMAKFVIFAKRDSLEEGKVRMFCMTDDKVDKTLEKQERFSEVARSRDIEVLEGRPQYVEMAGNLIPVTKSGDQLHINFKAFRENRLPCTVKIRDLDQEPSARVAFMRDPKVARGEAPQSPICNLNITLPNMSKSDSNLELDSETLEVRNRHSLLREHGIVLTDTISRGRMKMTDVADSLQGDWIILGQQLDVSMSEINRIKTEYKTVNDQALAMLHLWVERNKGKATGNALESALRKINREDVVIKCMYNVEMAEDEMEAAAARVAMDQSGFDTFKEEVGITKDSMKRGMSLDVQYDEQDLIKESESAAESSSPSSDRGSLADRTAPKVEAEATSSRPESITEEQILSELDVRRSKAKVESPEETDESRRKKKAAYLELAYEMDRLADEHDAAERKSQEVSEDRLSVSEDSVVRIEKGSPDDPTLTRSFQPSVNAPCVDVEPELGNSFDVEEEGTRTPPPSPSDKQPISEETIPRVSVEEAAGRLVAEAAVGADQSDSEWLKQTDAEQAELHRRQAEEYRREAEERIRLHQEEDALRKQRLDDERRKYEHERRQNEITPDVDRFQTEEDDERERQEIGAQERQREDIEESIDDILPQTTPREIYPLKSDTVERMEFIPSERVSLPQGGPMSLEPQLDLDTADQILSPTSDGSYHDGPSSVPEPQMPLGFVAEDRLTDKDSPLYEYEPSFNEFSDRTEEHLQMTTDTIKKPTSPTYSMSFNTPGEQPVEIPELVSASSKHHVQFSDEEQEETMKVFGDNLEHEKSVYQMEHPKGRQVARQIARHELPHQGKSIGERVMEIVESEGPIREEETVEDREEILPDGTIHKYHKVRRHSVKRIKKRSISFDEDIDEEVCEADEEIPGTKKEDIIETFIEPARCVTEEEEVEELLPSGELVKRHVIMNRMVHHIKTRQKSFDEGSGTIVEEDFEIDEIIPGTVSAFLAGPDSSSSDEFCEGDSEDDEELSGELKADLGELKEVLEDGTVITKRLVVSEEIRKVRSRSGSFEETDEVRREEEIRITPSPRSQSPAGNAAAYDDSAPVEITRRVAHLEEVRHGGVVDDNIQWEEETLRKGALKSLDDSIDSGPSHTGDESMDSSLTGGAGEESTRLLLKREIHKRTIIGPDGREETMIREDLQVRQDNEPPEELRDSMQDIINQFMDTSTDMPQQPRPLEDDV